MIEKELKIQRALKMITSRYPKTNNFIVVYAEKKVYSVVDRRRQNRLL